MRGLLNSRKSFLTGAVALLILALFLPWSGATAGQLSIGVIEYNAKASQGGWTLQYGKPKPLPLQVQLIADKISDTSNPSPVQFIALVQADDGGGDCEYLISCALKSKVAGSWTTITSTCTDDKTQLAYSSEWTLVKSLADGYGTDYCWSRGRPYNIAYFKNSNNDMVLFVIVHMPHGALDYTKWHVDAFKDNVRTVVGNNVDLKKVNLIVAGDMNELGGDAIPKSFAPIFGDFGDVKISVQSKTPPDPTCCADDPPGYQFFFDRVVTNSSLQPSYEVLYLTKNGTKLDYPLDKLKTTPRGKPNKEHKATYGVVKFN